MIRFDYNKSYKQGQIIADEAILNFVRNNFSVENPAKKFQKKFPSGKKRHIPDRNYSVSATGLFDFGMYEEIIRFLIENQFTEIKFTKEFKDYKRCGFEVESLWNGLSKALRYYQEEALIKALKIGRGVVLLGTGGGKSLMQASLIENFIRNHTERKFKCLILVPGTSLKSQLGDDFEDYEVTFSYETFTGEGTPESDVVICNNELFLKRFKNNKWMQDVDLLIVDECHKMNSSSKTTKLLKQIKTKNKFGFTGTLPKPKRDLWKVLGTFGPVIYEKNSKELRDEKFLTEASIRILKLKHTRPPELKYREELDYLYNCDARNELIFKICQKLNNNVLVLVNNLVHGEVLKSYLERITGKTVYFVEGEVEVEERDRIKKIMEENDNVICIAMSAIFAVGINITNIHYILFVGLGKSFIRTVQSIGRGLRLHESKNKLTIFDFYDNMHYSTKHSDVRKESYVDQQIEYTESVICL